MRKRAPTSTQSILKHSVVHFGYLFTYCGKIIKKTVIRGRKNFLQHYFKQLGSDAQSKLQYVTLTLRAIKFCSVFSVFSNLHISISKISCMNFANIPFMSRCIMFNECKKVTPSNICFVYQLDSCSERTPLLSM